MQNYSFTIALRFWHPTIDPEVITARLGLTPTYSSMAGEPRFTPKGTQLEGLHRESYWHCSMWDGWRESTETSAEDAVLDLLSRLIPNREFILGLLSTARQGLIHMSSHGSGNYALVFSPDILTACSSFGLSLAHDVYSAPQA